MFEDLSAPFADSEIEWRVMRCGDKNNKVWAQLAAYVDARAIMNRLDSTVGPENWQTKFREIQTPNGAGILCSLSLYVDNRWVAKEDGADFSRGIEITKSGISDSLKRVAVQWGIGRSLYTLPTVWAENIQDGYPPHGSDSISILSKEKNIKAWCPRPAMSKFLKPTPKEPSKKVDREIGEYSDWTKEQLIAETNAQVDQYVASTSVEEGSEMLDRAVSAKVLGTHNYQDCTELQLATFIVLLKKKLKALA